MRRQWFRIHLSTAIIATFFMTLMFWLNGRPAVSYRFAKIVWNNYSKGSGAPISPPYVIEEGQDLPKTAVAFTEECSEQGWPLRWHDSFPGDPLQMRPSYSHVHFANLAIDLLFSLIIAILFALFWEWNVRRRARNQSDQQLHLQFHLSTLVILAFVTGCLLFGNLRNQDAGGVIDLPSPPRPGRILFKSEPRGCHIWERGWPFRCFLWTEPRRIEDYVDSWNIGLNIILCFGIILFIAVCCEWRIRRRQEARKP